MLSSFNSGFLGRFSADVEYHALRFLVRLGPAKGDQGGAVGPELDVAPSQRCRFRPAQ